MLYPFANCIYLHFKLIFVSLNKDLLFFFKISNFYFT